MAKRLYCLASGDEHDEVEDAASVGSVQQQWFDVHEIAATLVESIIDSPDESVALRKTSEHGRRWKTTNLGSLDLARRQVVAWN